MVTVSIGPRIDREVVIRSAKYSGERGAAATDSSLTESLDRAGRRAILPLLHEPAGEPSGTRTGRRNERRSGTGSGRVDTTSSIHRRKTRGARAKGRPSGRGNSARRAANSSEVLHEVEDE